MATVSFAGRAGLGGILGAGTALLLTFLFWNDAADILLLLVLPPPLAIVGAACGALTEHPRWPSLFLLSSLAAGLAFWWATDWRFYVDLGEQGMMPKFQLHPGEQFAVSAFVGVLFGGTLTGVVKAGWGLLAAPRRREAA